MNHRFTTSTMVCVNIPKERVLELVDYYTIKGHIILLSCFNIIDDIIVDSEKYLEMDKEKIGISDRLIVCGKLLSTDTYGSRLVEYSQSLGKEVCFLPG